MFSSIPLPNINEISIPAHMQQLNALRQSNLQNQIASSQAKYAPYQAYGNAFLTNQQAQWLPYQYQMQAMSNPLLWMAAQNNPALMNQLKTMLSNPSIPTGSQALNMPLPGAPDKNNLMSILMDKIGVGEGSSQPKNPLSMAPQSTPTNTQSAPVNNISNKDAIQFANNQQKAAGTFPAKTGNVGYNTPAANAANQVAASGGLSGTNALSAAEAEQQAAKEAVTGQAAAQTSQQSERSKQISAQSQIATTALKSLEAFSRNYDKSSYRGQFIGERAEKTPTLPGSSIAPEQLASRYANQFLTDLSGLGDTPAGRTDEGRSLIASGKVDLSLEPEAKKELVDSFRAKLTRMITLRDFATDFYKNNPGATDEQLVGLMNSYNKHAPSYDYENGKPIEGNEKKFKDFTSQEALNSYIANGDYDPYAGRNESEPSNQPEGKILGTKKINGQEYVLFQDGWHRRMK